MSSFFFKPQDSSSDESFFLNCTTDVAITRNAIVTLNKVESGKTITDNHRLDNAVVRFDGIITDVVTPSIKTISSDTWIRQVEALRESTPPKLLVVTVGTEVVKNCLITALEISKSYLEGKQSWKVSMTFQEVDVVNKASLVEVKAPAPQQKNDVAKKSRKSGSPTGKLGQAVTLTVGADALSGAYNFLTGKVNNPVEEG